MTLGMRHLTIRLRLSAIAAGVVAAVVALAFGGWSGFSTLLEAQSIGLRLERGALRLQEVMRGLNEFLLTEGTGTARQAVRRSEAAFLEVFEDVLGDPRTPPALRRELQERVQPLWAALQAGTAEVLAHEEGTISTDNGDAMVLFGRTVQHGERAAAALGEIRAAVEKSSAARAAQTLRSLAAAAGLAVAVVVVLMGFLHRSIAGPLAALAAAARRAAAGDLSERLELRRSDEIGVLADAFRDMGDSLRDVFARVKSVSGGVSADIRDTAAQLAESRAAVHQRVEAQKAEIGVVLAASREMAESIRAVGLGAASLSSYAQQSSSALVEMAASVAGVTEQASAHHGAAEGAASHVAQMLGALKDVAIDLHGLTASSEQVAVAVAQMNATVSGVEQQARDSAAMARAASSRASADGMEAIAEAVSGMDRIGRSVEELSAVIHRLARRSEEIGRIVAVIDDVASETSLLALNASILAAQAGEHGRGFRVVADEVKVLASRTSASTQEVAQMISAVQSETRESMELVRVGIGTVQEGSRLVEQVLRVLSRIHEETGKAAAMSEAILGATSEEAETVRHIADAVRLTARRIESVSVATRALDADSRALLETMDRIRDGSRQVMVITGEQRETSRQLSEAAVNVADLAGQISLAIEGHKGKSDDVAGAVERIDAAASELAGSLSGLGSRVGILTERARALVAEVEQLSV